MRLEQQRAASRRRSYARIPRLAIPHVVNLQISRTAPQFRRSDQLR
jgi:hypothetical protein